MSVRKQTYFSGTWYPGSKNKCLELLSEFDKKININDKTIKNIKGIITPHAGWIYSGITAWSAFHQAANDKINLAVIFAGHLSPFEDIHIYDVDEWETPIRNLETDRIAYNNITQTANFKKANLNRNDNAVEVILPMTAAAFKNAKIVVLGIPPNSVSIKICKKIGDIFTDREDVIFIGSTDLTHYGASYGFAPRGYGKDALTWVQNENDSEFIKLCEKADAEGVIHSAEKRNNACCAGAAAGAISASFCKQGILTHYSTSAEVSGDTSNFVGYAGIVLSSFLD